VDNPNGEVNGRQAHFGGNDSPVIPDETDMTVNGEVRPLCLVYHNDEREAILIHGGRAVLPRDFQPKDEDVAIVRAVHDGYALEWTPISTRVAYDGGARTVKVVTLPMKFGESVAAWFEQGATGDDLMEAISQAEISEQPSEQYVTIAACADSAALSINREWPALRLGVIPPAMEFPLEILPPTCRELAKSIANAVGCEVDAIAMQMLTVASGVIGRSIHLRIMDHIIVQPSLWHANVAPAGQGKTWGLKYLTQGAIREIGASLRLTNAAEETQYQEICKLDPKSFHPKPIRKQLMVKDTTMEALYEILAQNPRGVLSTLDELSVLFTGLNQYKGGKGADWAHALAIWTGDEVIINRKGKSEIYIQHPHLAISGNIVPSNLHLIWGPNREDGMAPRWLFTFSERHRKLTSSERSSVDQAGLDEWDRMIRWLWDRKPLMDEHGFERPAILDFTEEGREEYFRLYDQLAAEMNDPSFDPMYWNAWQKLDIYAGRFACVLECLCHAEVGADRLYDVEPDNVRDAWKLVDYCKTQYRRVLAYLNTHRYAIPHGVGLHLSWMKHHPDATRFSERDISQKYPPVRGYTEAIMADARDWLAERNAIRRVPMKDRDPSTPGRKPSPVWEIHPDLPNIERAAQSAQTACSSEEQLHG